MRDLEKELKNSISKDESNKRLNYLKNENSRLRADVGGHILNAKENQEKDLVSSNHIEQLTESNELLKEELSKMVQIENHRMQFINGKIEDVIAAIEVEKLPIHVSTYYEMIKEQAQLFDGKKELNHEKALLEIERENKLITKDVNQTKKLPPLPH